MFYITAIQQPFNKYKQEQEKQMLNVQQNFTVTMTLAEVSLFDYEK